MKQLEVLSLCLLVVFTGSWAHDFPASRQQEGDMGPAEQDYNDGNVQDYVQGQEDYNDVNIQDYSQGQQEYGNLQGYILEEQEEEEGGKPPAVVSEHVNQQKEDEIEKDLKRVLGGEGMKEQQEDGAIQDNDDDEEEGRKAYLMYIGEDDSEVEEMVAGEFYEGPSNSFVEMEEEEAPSEEGSPTQQKHGWFRGKRESGNEGEGPFNELQAIFQQNKGSIEALLQQDEGDMPALFQQDEGNMEQEQDEGKEGDTKTVTAQWNNKLHTTLRVTCSAGYGLYRIRSVFISKARDRLFRFYCKRVAPACVRRRGYNPSRRRCKWYKVNNIGAHGGAHCPTNYYLAGVYSRPTCKHDREWWGLCCNTPRICTKCRWTGLLNSYRRPINYYTRGVFGGMISYYNRHYMDRRYRVSTCSLRFC